MFKHILVPIDGSEISLHAGRRGIELAKIFKAKLTAVMAGASYRQLTDEGYLAPVLDVSRKAWEKNVAAHTKAILDRFAAEAEVAGVKCATVNVIDDNPHRAIIDTARKNDCDLLVMGSHGHGGFKHIVLGSETTRVLSQAKIPVLVYR